MAGCLGNCVAVSKVGSGDRVGKHKQVVKTASLRLAQSSKFTPDKTVSSLHKRASRSAMGVDREGLWVVKTCGPCTARGGDEMLVLERQESC